MRVVVLVLGLVLVLAPVMSTIAPGALSAASERLLSLNQYGSDDSVRYRLQEGRHAIDKIQAHPVIGSGLGADDLLRAAVAPDAADGRELRPQRLPLARVEARHPGGDPAVCE